MRPPVEIYEDTLIGPDTHYTSSSIRVKKETVGMKNQIVARSTRSNVAKDQKSSAMNQSSKPQSNIAYNTRAANKTTPGIGKGVGNNFAA